MDRSEQIFDYIVEFVEKHHYPPTVREIQEGLDISSTSVVEYHLKKLERDNYITRTKHKARSIVVKED